LGTNAAFRKEYELPIIRGRDAMASDKEREISEEKLKALLQTASRVIIRRTADLLSKYLPVKFEHVVFVRMTDEQTNKYQSFVKSKEVADVVRASEGMGGAMPLKQITTLKKLVNHPDLADEDSANSKAYGSSRPKLRPEASGKLHLLEKMLKQIKSTTTDKCVLISNYTQTLDMFSDLCVLHTWGHVRLDGSMTISKRQKLVDQFNNPESEIFCFLLSSKAGGCGLNLIGANRLVLFDPDWNPGMHSDFHKCCTAY